MRILYVKPYKGEIELVREKVSEHEVVAVTDIMEVEQAICDDVEVLSVFVDTTVDATILDRFPKLKYITTRSTGFDHVDVKTATERGIVVSHVPRYGSQTVAEFAFALLLALSRNTFRAHTDMLRDSALSNLEPYEGFDLSRKTIGVVGTGAIGRHVCKIALGFGMRVLAYDQYPNESLRLSDDVTYCDLPLLLQESDVVTLHVPATEETKHLIDGQMLALMKPTAYLINTARGEVVDTKALVQALKEGRIKGAGLDVLEGERSMKEEAELLAADVHDHALWQTLVASHALIDMHNVIVTPHIAFNTKEAKREITDITLANIVGFVKGETVNVVRI